ncbi:MAG: WD40 repeat domain-containing protein [Candidatus Bipolaricaulaceae bacterium]
MIAVLLGLLSLGAFSAEPVFLHPVTWVGDLVVAEGMLLVGTVGQVVEIDPNDGAIVRALPFPSGQVRALALGENFLVAGGWDLLRIWSWPEGALRVDIRGFGALVQDLCVVGNLILLAGGDGNVRAFSAMDGEALWAVRAHEGSVWGIAATPELFATAGGDRTAIWDQRTREELHSFPGRAWAVDFSPNGFLLAAGVGKILKVWDSAVGLPLWEAWAHESCTVAVAFSPDGKRVATGSLDQTAALWDGETGALLQRLRGFPTQVCAVGFSADGQVLVVAAEDGTLALVRLP